MRKIIAVDLDGVLCEEGDWSPEGFLKRKPIIENIKKINELYDKGNFIIIWTARREEDRFWTETWLKVHKVKYNVLILGKLYFDIYIDEKRKLMAIEEVSISDE